MRGIVVAGVGVGAGQRIAGLAISPGFVGAGDEIRGVVLAGLATGAPHMAGITVAALNGMMLDDGGFRQVNERMTGISIGLYNSTMELHGVQFGLLNRADNNPRWARILPLVNLHL